MQESDEKIAAKLREAVHSMARELAAPVGLPEQALNRLIDYSGAIGVVTEPSSSNAPSATLGSYSAPLRIIIRDDLLEPVKFFLTLLKGCVSLSTAVAALFAGGPHALSVAAIASSLGDLYELFQKTWNAAYRLTPVQWAVIWELSLAKRATILELSNRLPQIAPKDIEATLRQFMVNAKIPKNFTSEQDGWWQLVEV